MDFANQLLVLKQAQGDPARLALATVELAYPELPDNEKAALKEALQAAAMPHWCDESILSALLQIPLEESATRLSRLRGLNVVEAFPARGQSAVNVHETSRLALRLRLFKDDQATFRRLSGWAVSCFAEDYTPSGRIEWIYHLLCAEPDRGATELEKLDRAWTGSAHPEDIHALALAMMELEGSQLVEKPAQAWMLIVIAWSRWLRGEVAQLMDMANQILLLAQETQDLAAEGEAHALLGDAQQAQGHLVEAQAEFEQYLAISRSLAEQNQSNSDWQRELGIAHNRMGDVLRPQGKLEAAQAAYEQSLAIFCSLTEQDPGNVGWQRELGVSHSRVGGVLQALGKLETAQAEFEQYLAISRSLAEQDPSNAGRQRGLGVATTRWVACCRRKASWRRRWLNSSKTLPSALG